MRFSLSVILVFAGFAALAWGEPPVAATAHVAIRVSDPAGTAVPHARIRIVPAPDPAPAKTETDADGRLVLDLKPGGFGLFVTSPGFKSVVQHLEVAKPAAESAVPQTVPIALQIGSTSGPVLVGTEAPSPGSLTLAAFPFHDDVNLTPAALKAMPHTSVTLHNPHSGRDETYSGVPVSRLFETMGAPLGKELRGIALSAFVVATGADGYQAVLALAEVDPTFHPGDVLVADTMNGQPLDLKSGPFKLVVTEDKRPARSVHNLVRLELRSVAY